MADAVIHLEFNGKSARVAYKGLPDTRSKIVPSQRTAAGPISTVRITNGVNPRLDTKSLDAAALMAGDPELDLAAAGQILESENLTTAYYDPAESEPKPISDFQELDLIFDAQGNIKERRPHLNRRPNLNELHAVKIARRIPVLQGLTQFVFRQTFQILHNDSLTRDFLHGIAADLHGKQELAVLGAGPKSNQPLVVREKGSPYRAFLFGEIAEGDRYKLLLLLSDMELKRPAPEPAPV